MNTETSSDSINDGDHQDHQGQEPESEVATSEGAGKSSVPLIRLLRSAWLTAVVVGMIVAFFSVGQTTDWEEQNSSWESAVDLAADRYEANEALTSGAPQQSVANAWHTNDLLEAQVRVAAESSEALHAEYRTSAVLILILGLGLLGDRALAIWDRPKANSGILQGR